MPVNGWLIFSCMRANPANAATQTTAEVAKLHHDVDDDDLKPLGDPNSLYDDDDDDDDD